MLSTVYCILSTFSLAEGQNTSISPKQYKLGHINANELLMLMPGVKEADAKLLEYTKQLETQNQAMIAEYQNKVQDYQQNEASMIDAVKETKVKEITDLETRIQAFQQSANEKVAKRKEELYSHILEKANKAIKEVAREKNYDYVFDTSIGILLHFPDSDNIMPLVKAKLGLE